MKRTPNPPGRCIFCNSLGLTREHMWADWLHNYIPRERLEHYTAFNTFSPERPEQTLTRRTGDPHSVRIKCVCRKCNNEWMGQLQEEAKPYLVPMLQGKRIALFRNGQTAIAAWVTMMVMVSEYLEKDQGVVAISAADRRWFRQHHRPPSSRWRIWIGQHRRETYDLFLHNVLPMGTEEEGKIFGPKTLADPNTQTTTICLGDHLVIHVMSSDRVWNFMRRWKLPPEIAGMMAQIWPVRTSPVAWPTAATALTDDGLALLSGQFFEEMRLISRSLGRSS